MVIPEDSLLRDDGTVFSGQANLRMDVVNTQSLPDIVAAPEDFTSVDEDGEEQMLVSNGMLSLDFEDDKGKKLSPLKPIKLYLNPEKLNISVDSNGILQQDFGGWTPQQADGSEHLTCEWSKKPQAETNDP